MDEVGKPGRRTNALEVFRQEGRVVSTPEDTEGRLCKRAFGDVRESSVGKQTCRVRLDWDRSSTRGKSTDVSPFSVFITQEQKLLEFEDE